MDPNPDYLYNNGDIAFRLPSLKTEYQNLDYLQKGKQCPRETRVLAAFDRALENKKHKTKVKESDKLHADVNTRVDTLDASETRTFLRNLLDSELSTLNNTTDVVGYLVRELTEVHEAIEKSKDRLRKDTIKALWKVISGVLHSMGQENLRRALLSSTSPFKYENYSKALSLNPRLFRELEKREPVVHTPQFCRGCQVGGHLPWIYLYPDREVYRTGGGFECTEFQLPFVKSDKHLTIPRDPFSRSRGKLVDTRVHHFPAKRKKKLTNPLSFKFHGEMKPTKTSVHLPRAENSLISSSSSDIDVRSEASFLTDPAYLNGRNVQLSALSSKPESIQESEVLEKYRAAFKVQKDSGKGDSNSTTLNSEEQETKSIEKDDNHPSNHDLHDSKSSNNHTYDDELKEKTENIHTKNSKTKLQSLNRKFSTIVKQTDELTNDEDLTRKLKLKISIDPPKKRTIFNVVHNSQLLVDKPNDAPEKRTFAGSKVSSTKLSGFGRKKTSVDVNSMTTRSVSSTTGVFHKRESTSMTTSSADLSLRFSSSLSLSYPDTEATDSGLMEFSLAGAKMKPSTRKTVTEKYNAPGYKAKATRSFSKTETLRRSVEKNENGNEKKRLKKTSKADETSDYGLSLSSIEDTPSANISSISLTSGIESDMANEKERDDSEDDYWQSEKSFLFMKEEQNNEYDDDANNSNPDEFDDEYNPEESTNERKKRRKGKRRQTLQFRMQPLSTYTLRRGSRNDDDSLLVEEEDETMLDYAARYCIISLERLSKYENIFKTYSSLETELDEQIQSNVNDVNEEVIGETERQKTLLSEYEKLVFGMDVCQQRISEADKKKLDLLRQHQQSMENFSNDKMDESQKKLLEAAIQAFTPKINSVENRIKQFLGKINKMMEKKKDLEENLREAGMEEEKIEKLVKNNDFLERRFSKMKKQQMSLNYLSSALRDLNRNFSDEDFKFVTKILNLPKKEWLDFKAFAIVAALSERVKSLDKSIKTLLREVDLVTLERKLDKCKELYRLLAEENPSHGNRLVPVDNLAIELQAGGLEDDHQKSVIGKLDHQGQGFIDFLDFILYVPLFLMIHDQIVSQPFSMDFSKDQTKF